MHYRIRAIWAILMMTLLASCKNEEQGSLVIDPAQFQFTSQGNYGHRLDERGLFQIFHPLARSAKGDYGTATIQITIPPTAKPPYCISFYLSDNNEACGLKEPPSINSRSSAISVIIDERTGHRFQRCWIGGVEVWKRDTIEANDDTFHTIDITKHVKPGERFEIRFGMTEEVDSTVRLPNDRFIKSNVYGSNVHAGMDFSKYETRSYWGDFSLHWGEVGQLTPKKSSWTRPLLARNARNHPLAEKFSLEVENRQLLQSRWSWPVSMGVPLPNGAVKETSFTLKYGGGSLPLRATPMNHWDDGTIRWARLQFTLPSGLEDKSLNLFTSDSSEVQPQSGSIKTATLNHGQFIGNGLLSVELKPNSEEALLVKNQDGDILIRGVEIFGETADLPWKVAWQSIKIEETSDWQARRVLCGMAFDPTGKALGELRLSVDLFANVPYLRTKLTFINYVSGGLNISKYGYRLGVVSTSTADNRTNGWLTGINQAGGWVGVVKHFEHLWPNAIRTIRDGIEIDCFIPGDERLPTLKLGGGEALGSEMWFAFERTPIQPKEAEAFMKLVESPPRLNSSAMIRDSKVWGDMIELNARNPMYERIIDGHLAQHCVEVEKGVQMYGNYKGGLAENFYWNAIHSMYCLYAMTGERRWFDWAERSAEHMMDHLINHVPQDGRESGGVRLWVGADKPLRFDLKTQIPNGLFDYWAMSGDRRAYHLAKGVADFLVNDEKMVDGIHWKSARYQGWALVFLMAAYQETKDPRYLKAADTAVGVVASCVDSRRGAYIEHHGNPSFKGIIPFMNGNLMTGLREMHRQTGNKEAARLLVEIAWGIYAEMQVTAKPGYYEYSPDPYKRSISAAMNPGICAGQAYAAMLTGDRQLASIAQQGWMAFLAEKPLPKKTFAFCYDLPAALYWLQWNQTELKSKTD